MPEPTSPKKRALMPSSPLRRALRAAGHHLSPVVQIGKDGLGEAVLRQLDEALLAHELVKVKVGTESPEDRFEVADRLGAASIQVAQVLGRTVLAYRRHPEKPRFEAAPAAPPRPARGAPARGRPAAAGRPAKGRPVRERPGKGRPARETAKGRPARERPAREEGATGKPGRRAPAERRPASRRPAGRTGKPAGRPAGKPARRPRAKR